MTDVAIIRLRPHNAVAQGLSKGALEDLGRALSARSEEPRIERSSFDPEHEASEQLVDDLRLILKGCLRESTTLVLDLGYRASHRQTYMRVITRALAKCVDANDLKIDQTRILLLTQDFLPEHDPLMQLLMSDPWRSAVQICDSQGNFIHPDKAWPIREEVHEASRQSSASRKSELQQRLLRVRGVFKHRDHGAETYTKYRYLGDLARPMLTEQLASLFEREDFKAIVTASDASPWFLDCIDGAALNKGVPVLRWDSSAGEIHELGGGLREMLRITRGSVCVAVPVYRTGHLARLLSNAIEELAPGASVAFIAIFAQSGTNQESEDTDFGRRRSITINGRRRTLHYAQSVRGDSLPRNHWLVQTALAMGEVAETPHVWVDPSRTAMWSLFAECHMGPERPHPVGRKALAHFPLLKNMEPEDATWLAYAIVKAADLLDNEDVLVVLPREDIENGTAKLAAAFEKSLGLATIEVPRSVLNGESPLPDRYSRKIQDFADRVVIVVDESAVGGSTLDRLADVISAERDSQPDLRAVVVGAFSDGVTSDLVRAVYQWTPNDFEEEAVTA